MKRFVIVPLLSIILLSIGLAVPEKPDATAELQRTIDAGGLVDLPDGLLKISKPIELRSGTRLVGDRTTIGALGTVKGGVFVIGDGAERVSIEGLKIDAALCQTAIKNAGRARQINLRGCTLTGSIPHTNFLVDFDGDVSNVTLEDCTLASTLTGIRVRGTASDVTLSRCTVTDWRTYGVLIRGTNSAGPANVNVSHCHFHSPAKGKGGSRQMIVAYSETSTPVTNISGLRIVGNTCEGPAEPYDAHSETSRGTADQIAITSTNGFLIEGNSALDGGENGIAVTLGCVGGIVAHNLAAGNDAHGIQVGCKNNRPEADVSDILVTGNHSSNNGARRDKSRDSMAALYFQDTDNVSVLNNQASDTGKRRQHKSGLHFAGCVNTHLGDNAVYFLDRAGATPVAIFDDR